jgi:multisubunit Na+/H+ antiporter MnhG subunit
VIGVDTGMLVVEALVDEVLVLGTLVLVAGLVLFIIVVEEFVPGVELLEVVVFILTEPFATVVLVVVLDRDVVEIEEGTDAETKPASIDPAGLS